MADTRDESQQASDQSVLFPEHELKIGGETVVVREFRFLEGVRLAPRVEPVVAGLEAAARDQATGLSLMHALMAEETDLMVELMATACDRDVSFVDGLSSSDGNDLLMAFWAVNQRFFLRQLALRVLEKSSAAPAGETSSQPSSDTATDGPTSDDATRDDS